MPSWFTRDQVDRIQAALHDGHAVMVELMVCSGPRWGEAAAVGRERADGKGNVVDWTRRRLRITGGARPVRPVEGTPQVVQVPAGGAAAAGGVRGHGRAAGWPGAGGLVFVATRRSPGKKTFPPVSGANWRKIWYAAIDKANARIAKENERLPKGERLEPIPAYDPHDCRHTAASWLVQEGVPLYHVQALLGHESFATTQRYANSQELHQTG
jgi:integrase